MCKKIPSYRLITIIASVVFSVVLILTIYNKNIVHAQASFIDIGLRINQGPSGSPDIQHIAIIGQGGGNVTYYCKYAGFSFPGNHQWDGEAYECRTNSNFTASRTAPNGTGAMECIGGGQDPGCDELRPSTPWAPFVPDIVEGLARYYCPRNYTYPGVGTQFTCSTSGGGNSPLKIAKNGVVYDVALVDPDDPNATRARVMISGGIIKALRSCTVINGCAYSTP